MKKEEQAALVSNITRLPKQYMGGPEYPTALLEALGFQIGEPIDEFFNSVTAPAGWTLRSISHSMHSDIVDDKGRVRGSVFYKDAFNDRRVDFKLHRRYVSKVEFNDEKGKGWIELKDLATGETICRSPEFNDFDWAQQHEERTSIDLERIARFPQSDDVAAYWG